MQFMGLLCKSYIADVGIAFETLVLGELRSRFVAIEAKASSQWRSEWNRPLAMISERGSIDAAYGVYLGKKTIVSDGVIVLPFAEFSRRLWDGEIF